MNPHQFPGIVLTADVGIFVPAVQKKAVPGLGVHSGKAAVSAIAGGGGAAPSAHIAAGGRNWLGGVAVCDLAAAGEPRSETGRTADRSACSCAALNFLNTLLPGYRKNARV